MYNILEDPVTVRSQGRINLYKNSISLHLKICKRVQELEKYKCLDTWKTKVKLPPQWIKIFRGISQDITSPIIIFCIRVKGVISTITQEGFMTQQLKHSWSCGAIYGKNINLQIGRSDMWKKQKTIRVGTHLLLEDNYQLKTWGIGSFIICLLAKDIA